MPFLQTPKSPGLLQVLQLLSSWFELSHKLICHSGSCHLCWSSQAGNLVRIWQEEDCHGFAPPHRQQLLCRCCNDQVGMLVANFQDDIASGIRLGSQ